MNRNLVGSTYGRFCIKFPQSRMKGERHRLSPLNLQFHNGKESNGSVMKSTYIQLETNDVSRSPGQKSDELLVSLSILSSHTAICSSFVVSLSILFSHTAICCSSFQYHLVFCPAIQLSVVPTVSITQYSVQPYSYLLFLLLVSLSILSSHTAICYS